MDGAAVVRRCLTFAAHKRHEPFQSRSRPLFFMFAATLSSTGTASEPRAGRGCDGTRISPASSGRTVESHEEYCI